MWTLAFGHHEDRMPTHGYEATRPGAFFYSRRQLLANAVIILFLPVIAA
jgi:hypothetical protein